MMTQMRLPLLALVENARSPCAPSLACVTGCDVDAADCSQGHRQGGGRSPLHDRGALQSAAALHSVGKRGAAWCSLLCANPCPATFLPPLQHKFRLSAACH